MSPVDTRYRTIWQHLQRFNQTKNDLWLDMIENCTFSDDPLEVKAANRVLSRFDKDHHVNHSR